MNGDGVPALSRFGLCFEGVRSRSLIDLGGIGEVADVHPCTGGSLVERDAGQDFQDALHDLVRRDGIFHHVPHPFLIRGRLS
ncbi:hypothetical protein [Streptomyces ipomoeae]|uniref:hypothetical protein n=1 Tax=Streptomyces ipomoeae TaxID=103232 RepID=UPI0029C9D37B|nr:hypothetical protein [Streptomyces ipomoeae]